MTPVGQKKDLPEEGSGIYNRLKVLRVERGLSRKQLAQALDVNYQTIGYIERGDYNPSLELAFRASGFFGLPIEAIFSPRPFEPLSERVYGGGRDGSDYGRSGYGGSTSLGSLPGERTSEEAEPERSNERRKPSNDKSNNEREEA